VLSTVTPKLFTVVVTGTVVAATLIARISSSDLSLVSVLITTASVLSDSDKIHMSCGRSGPVGRVSDS